MLTDYHELYWNVVNCLVKSKIINVFINRLKRIDLKYRYLL